jgi:hypothetical protein
MFNFFVYNIQACQSAPGDFKDIKKIFHNKNKIQWLLLHKK